MAVDKNPPAAAAPPQYTDADKARARQWFKKSADSRQKLEYDFAIESILQGLSFWPDAVQDGLMPLRSLALQRAQAGHKKPGMMDTMKRSVSGKDYKQNYLNALWLYARDPTDASYAEAVVKNAAKAGFFEALQWFAPLALELLKKDKKPNLAKFKAFRDALIQAADWADTAGMNQHPAPLLDIAVSSLDFLRARVPTDDAIRSELRDVSSRLTIVRGKYQTGEDFRDSIRDAEQQKVLHDAGRVQQGEATADAVVSAARKDYEQFPTVPSKINALADALLRRERLDLEREAIAILMKAYNDSKNYSFKLRADDVRLRQWTRQTREMVDRARQSGSDEDKLHARLAATEQLEGELEIWRERCDNYPTDLRMRAKLGTTLFRAKRYDEAIPVLQQAQNEPRSRYRSIVLIARCFLEQDAPAQARDVIQEVVDAYDIPGDDTHKEMLYWLARAAEAQGDRAAALGAYGKLLRLDYSYAEGDARRRHDALKASPGTAA